jgi:hypothetical protein
MEQHKDTYLLLIYFLNFNSWHHTPNKNHKTSTQEISWDRSYHFNNKQEFIAIE